MRAGGLLSGEPLRRLLLAEGGDLTGFGDIRALAPGQWNSCVSLAVRLPASTICGITDGPTPDYFEQYHGLNAKLDHLAELAASYLTERGFQALAQTTTVVVESAGYRTSFPHKTCATRAGLGREITLCGKCIAVCPYTQSYINRYQQEDGNDL